MKYITLFTRLLSTPQRLFEQELRSSVSARMFAGLLLTYSWLWIYQRGYAYETLTSVASSGLKIMCWPYFQNCESWYVFNIGSLGNEFGFFITLLFVLLFSGVYWFITKQYRFLWYTFIGLCISKISIDYLYSYAEVASYDYYHLFFLLIFACAPHRLWFCQIFFALCYLLSTLLKLNIPWLVGYMFFNITYFETAIMGPLGTWIDISLLTTGIVLLFAIAPYGLWHNEYTHKIAYGFLLLFHLVTIPFIGIHYPSLMIGALFVLYRIKPTVPINITWRSCSIGIIMITCAVCAHMYSFMIPGDEKYTGEGVRYGLYMFDAARSCESRYQINHLSTEETQPLIQPLDALRRCYVYTEWFHLQRYCNEPHITTLSWKYYHSNGGGPYYKLVDIKDVCTTPFSAWSHNSWIEGNPEKNQVEILKQNYRELHVPTKFGQFIETHIDKYILMLGMIISLGYLLYITALIRCILYRKNTNNNLLE